MDLPIPEAPADPIAQARHDRARFFNALLIALGFVALLWWIKMLEMWLGQSLSGLGVRPGSVTGLVGLVAAPLLHGSVGHLLNNTLPLLVLGTLAIAIYPRAFRPSILLIWLGSGLGIWLFGRDSVHLGASGVNHGLMLFLFTLGLLRRDRPGIAAMMIAFLLYGGMLLTVFPGDPQISWEAHLFGAISGIAAALLWRKRDPQAARKKYSWDLEDEQMRAMEDKLAAEERDLYEPQSPRDVPVLWHGPGTARDEPRGVVVPFRPRREGDAPD